MYTGTARRRASSTLLAAAVTLGGAFAAALVGVETADADAAEGSACRTVPVDADPVLRSDLARLDFGVDGTGVTVGIISNSYFLTDANSTPDQNVADGLLPGPGNPCGYTTPVEVALEAPSDLPSPDDEGRGMAELVHGVAPGARIVFASADTDGGMGAALSALEGRGVDIIVDDITEPTEAWFQEALVNQTIDGLKAQGVTYFSAAGNETVLAQNPPSGVPSTPVNGWQTSAYRAVECQEPLRSFVRSQTAAATFDCMDFDHGDGIDTVSTITADLDSLVPAGSTTTALDGYLQWGEPFQGAQTQFRLVIAVTDTQGQTTYIPSESYGAEYPVNKISLALDPSQYADAVSLDVSIIRYTDTPLAGTMPPVGYLFTANGPQWIDAAEYWESNEHDTVGRTVIGHNGGPSVITIAATDGTDDDRIDYYSSLGPVTYYLTPETLSGQATRLEALETHRKPKMMSVDNVRNSVLGTATDTPGVFRFRGTSAASPNAAAVAALALQLNPDLTPADIERLMAETATRLPSPYAMIPEADSVGAGLVDAYAFLEKAQPAVQPQPARLAATGSDLPVGGLVAGGLFLFAGIILVRSRRRTA